MQPTAVSLASTKSVTLLPFARHVGNRQHRSNFIKRTKTTFLPNRGTNKFAEGGDRNPLIIYVANHQHQWQQLQGWDYRLTSNNSRVGTHTHFKTLDRTVTLGRHGSVLAAASLAQPWDKISYHHFNFDAHPTHIPISTKWRRLNTVHLGQALPTTTNIGNHGATSRVGRRTTRITLMSVRVGMDISKGDLDKRRGYFKDYLCGNVYF